MLNASRLLARSSLIAFGLALFKLAVFFMTNSVAILASAADSFMDFVVSFANFILYRTSSKPADPKHPYGHGKIESLAGIVQSLTITAMIGSVAMMSVKRLLAPAALLQPLAGLVIITVALILNAWHSRNLGHAAEHTGSQLMAGEHLHYRSDTLMYIGVLAALALSKITGKTFWDPIISLCIVAYLLKHAVGLFRETLSELLDASLPKHTLDEIDGIIRGFHANVLDYHDLRTRKVGATKFIEFHVVLKDVHGLREAHAITERLIEKLKATYPDSVVTIYADPEGAH
jgi:cation diffusion facilitator family transporter